MEAFARSIVATIRQPLLFLDQHSVVNGVAMTATAILLIEDNRNDEEFGLLALEQRRSIRPASARRISRDNCSRSADSGFSNRASSASTTKVPGQGTGLGLATHARCARSTSCWPQCNGYIETPNTSETFAREVASFQPPAGAS